VKEVELGIRAFCAIVAIGTLSGLAGGWAFRRCSNPPRLRAAVNRILAHLFELHLFSDEPGLVLRAQRDLLAANGQFLLEVTRPSLILVLPFAVLLAGTDAIFGRAPLQIGKAAVVTLHGNPSQTTLLAAQLDAPRGMRVETPALKIPRLQEMSWRVRPFRATRGALQIRCNGRVITKSVSSSPGLQWLSDRRAGSVAGFLLHPLELPFADKSATWISLEYPGGTILNRSWMVWFFAACFAGALGFGALLRWT
jgi:hypothetical protein